MFSVALMCLVRVFPRKKHKSRDQPIVVRAKSERHGEPQKIRVLNEDLFIWLNQFSDLGALGKAFANLSCRPVDLQHVL